MIIFLTAWIFTHWVLMIRYWRKEDNFQKTIKYTISLCASLRHCASALKKEPAQLPNLGLNISRPHFQDTWTSVFTQAPLTVKTYRHLTSSPSHLQTSKHLCVFNPNGDLSWVIKNCYWGEAEETRRKHPKNPSGWDGAIRILAPCLTLHSLTCTLYQAPISISKINLKNARNFHPGRVCPRKIPAKSALSAGSVPTPWPK